MIVKCTKCHHEWHAYSALLEPDKWGFYPAICDWCRAPGEKLADDYIERWRQGGAVTPFPTPRELQKVIDRLREAATAPLPDYTVCQKCVHDECWLSPAYCGCFCHNTPEEDHARGEARGEVPRPRV